MVAQQASSDGERKLLGEYRTTIMQKSYITAENASEATDESRQAAILKFAFLVEPKVDIKRLKTAFRRLSARHEAMRMSIAMIDGSWRVRVWDRHKAGVVVEEHGRLTEVARSRLVAELADRPLDMMSDDLIQFMLLSTKNGGDILVVRAHHCVVDGHSMLILAEELLKFLIGIPVLGAAKTFEEYLRIAEQVSLERQEQIDNYWQQLLFPALIQPGSGAFGTGERSPRRIFSKDHFRIIQKSLDIVDYRQLPALARAPDQTSFMILFAAYAQTFIDFSSLSGIYVVTYIDRVSRELQDYVGNAVQHIPVRCENPNKLPLGQFASCLSAQIKASIAHLPSEACAPELKFDHAIFAQGGALRSIHCAEVFQSARATKSIFAGNFDSPVGYRHKLGPAFITRLQLPQQSFTPNGLNLRIQRTSRTVQIEITYHRNLYPDKSIADFVAALQKQLGIAIN